MTKSKKQLIKDTLAHWDRMIRWAKKQRPRDTISIIIMEHTIGEGWGDESCPLCKRYWKKGCVGCPIEIRYAGYCRATLYRKACQSRTWGTWAKRAKLFRKQIADLQLPVK